MVKNSSHIKNTFKKPKFHNNLQQKEPGDLADIFPQMLLAIEKYNFTASI